MTSPKLPKDIWKKRVGSMSGAAILGAMAAVGILLIGFYLREPVLPPSPALVSGRASGRALAGVNGAQSREPDGPIASGPAIQAPACRAGEECSGPTVAAVDPEGDGVVYRFYDQDTGALLAGPIFALSGEEVAPRFRFDAKGEKRLYLTVEDSGGHAAPKYRVLVPVE